MSIEKRLFIESNQKIITEWQKKHPDTTDVHHTRMDDLDRVLQIIDDAGNPSDTKENLIIKAAYIMGATSWAQPFVGGNKRTGILVAATFLNENGYLISISKEDEVYLREVLYRIQDNRSELDSSIIRELILYISTKISKL
ncbi:MAG: Fic family protein [Nitrosopumilaceae archaeon]